uniref:Uncharacterized protein n=1 Tax=Sphaerodactylus townsendi TaxID=933632 RepID=A0ACB8FTF8_9SAUR
MVIWAFSPPSGDCLVESCPVVLGGWEVVLLSCGGRVLYDKVGCKGGGEVTEGDFHPANQTLLSIGSFLCHYSIIPVHILCCFCSFKNQNLQMLICFKCTE